MHRAVIAFTSSFLLAAIIYAGPASSGEDARVRCMNGVYSFKIPAGWEVMEDESHESVLLELKDGPSGSVVIFVLAPVIHVDGTTYAQLAGRQFGNMMLALGVDTDRVWMDDAPEESHATGVLTRFSFIAPLRQSPDHGFFGMGIAKLSFEKGIRTSVFSIVFSPVPLRMDIVQPFTDLVNSYQIHPSAYRQNADLVEKVSRKLMDDAGAALLTR